MTLHPPVGPDDYVKGPADAPATLVEYGDYQCPYCGEAFGFVQQLQQEFGDRLRFCFRNFPIPEIHPQAMAAAETAEFCGANGSFWPAHDTLYDNQERLGPELYVAPVRELGLSVDELEAALNEGTYRDRIQDQVNGGLRSEVNGTPTFFLNGNRVALQGSYAELAGPISRVIEAAQT